MYMPHQNDAAFKTFTGGCQCGNVRYTTDRLIDNAHLCHCRMCQKAVGNIFAALVSTPKDALYWTSDIPAFWQSSGNVRRGFCANCGTPLYYDDTTSGQIGLTIGSLDDAARHIPLSHDGIEGRVPWFESINDIPDKGFTEMPEQAEWAAAIKASNRQHPDKA
jgi:hypothetical protein